MEVKTQLDKVMNKEVRAMERVGENPHPNVIKLIEVIDSEDHLVLVMEFAELGRVVEWQDGRFRPADWLDQKDGFACEEVVRRVVRDIAMGL